MTHKIKLIIVGLLWKFLGKKQMNDKGEDDLRTSKATQDDVVSLYSGAEMMSFEIYGELITTYWCCIMFSSGMPVLYFVGFIYYAVFYCIYKVLILKFYQTAHTFNQNLAINATNMIHFALVFHIIIASMMFSNQRILGMSKSGKDKNVFHGMVQGMDDKLRDRFQNEYSV
jgi:hypothetical protein